MTRTPGGGPCKRRPSLASRAEPRRSSPLLVPPSNPTAQPLASPASDIAPPSPRPPPPHPSPSASDPQLATEFRLRSVEVVERIRGLEAQGALTGVMDERGKYIFVSPEEMRAVADFIRTRGRVHIAELAAKSGAAGAAVVY